MATRELLSESITLTDAKERTSNVIQELTYPQLKHDFFKHLGSQRSLIRALVAHHLSIDAEDCNVSTPEHWLHGSFNVCVLAAISVSNPRIPKFVIIRFPLPYRVGEATHPGNADEKLRCEAAAYAWLQKHCPSIPIPQLYGLGLSSGQQVRQQPSDVDPAKKVSSSLTYITCLDGHAGCINYAGYLIIETITDGEPLSLSWDEKCNDARLRKNLYQGLAKILLTLTAAERVPRIGAFRLDDSGYLQLDNRPLSVEFIMQENEDIPLHIPRQATFNRVDEFILEHLAAFDNRLVHQPNAIRDIDDGLFQMAGLAAARAIFPQMFRRDLRHGPFAFSLTDLHRSNIIVDDDWNIVSLIDLEFACSWPLEFQQPPFWLGGNFIQDIDETTLTTHFSDFMQVLEEQEASLEPKNLEKLSSIMRNTWTTGAYWVTLAVKSPISFNSVFFDRIVPYHLGNTTDGIKVAEYVFLASLWSPGNPKFVERKVQDYENYLKELDTIFSDEKPSTPSYQLISSDP